jgi:hypothetical protein
MKDEEQLTNDFASLMREISRLGIRDLTAKPYRSRPLAFMLKAPKGFAWVYLRTRLGCLRIGTKKEWADTSGASYEYVNESGAWNDQAVYWKIYSRDGEKIKKVAGELVQVWRIVN